MVGGAGAVPATSLEYLTKQKDFLEKHLLAWVPSFCKDLEQAAESGFYKGIAQLTAEFINSEQETIAALMDEFQGQ
jgi:TorA maturation chaperone TorD